MGRFWLMLGIWLWGMDIVAQAISWKDENWECRIAANGCLEQIVFKSSGKNDTIPFFCKGEHMGPSFYVVQDGKSRTSHWISNGSLSYRTNIDGVECMLKYEKWHDVPAMRITLTNKGHVPFQPEKAGIKMGIDTYMDQYPTWFGKYFPTLMRNERTHFWGYLQTPSGNILGIVSPQPIASWSVEYNLGYQDPPPHWFMGHRIESLNLDLLNTLPLPLRNPQNLWKLEQGETKTWIIALTEVVHLDKLEERLHELASIPMIRIDKIAYVPGEEVHFDVISSNGQIRVVNDCGIEMSLQVEQLFPDVKRVSCCLPEVGLYTIQVVDGNKKSEGVLSVHSSWKWTLEQARKGALKYHQKATSHVESWYGFHTAFLAARHFPNEDWDEPLRQRFDYLFGLLYDQQKMEPKYYASRIQNTSGTISMLVDKFQAYHNINDLRKASRLADWLMKTWQRKDGAYVNHNTVYTSVIYVAKSILELTLEERKLGKTDRVWATAAKRHYQSAKRAIDQLVMSKGNFETEGELTFEDGMISCSALQIGMLALMQKDKKVRQHYTDAMLRILQSHDCLTQLRIPDARRRGGTMRYWEAQYDVQMLPNMFNSPHGWSAWRAYATYYAYLLTGNERWLNETYNAMGAFSNLIDYKTGNLRWAFVVDPYVRVKQACSVDMRVTEDSLSFGNPHPELYDTRSFVIGEQYVNMISDWQTVNTQDNDVHELFKCLEETMLVNAFIVEREDGSVIGYNCKVKRLGDTLDVIADETQIVNLHCNLKSSYKVSFCGQVRNLKENYLGWAFGENIYE